MDRQSIIGFTEAELGLFVAILFLVLALAGGPNEKDISHVPEPPPSADSSPPRSEDLIRSLEEQLARSKDQISRHAAKITELERELATLKSEREKQQNLRSRQIPTCTEKKVAAGPIRDVIVMGANSFHVGSSTHNLQSFLETVKTERLQADKEQCRHVIRVYYSPNLSGPETLSTRIALSQYFYLQESLSSKD